MRLDFIELTRDDVRWPFEHTPYVVVGGPSYARETPIDPFPCYAHDMSAVRATANKVVKAFPVGVDVRFYVMSMETPGRTNGYMQRDADYGREMEEGRTQYPWSASIMLQGKRIPPHPAMTRYLVGHEYGHVVQHWLEYEAGEKDSDNKMIAEYGEIRGLQNPRFYGGGTWHKTIGEIFANDFRILVCGIETEYWPHQDITRPEQLPAVTEFWAEQTKRAVA